MTAQTRSNEPIRVYLEAGAKRVFACALDWPGWCRSGKTEQQALDDLAGRAERYALVAREAGIPFPEVAADSFDVAERIRGSATTDFGAPGAIPASDAEPMTAEDAERHAALVRATWTILDRIAARAPVELRKGPRGGGRDRDKVVNHILGTEVSYARKLGVKHHQPALDDPAAIAALRDAVIAALLAAAADPPTGPKAWPPRYAARRIAWHVLDHAWEIEDRTTEG